MAGKEDLHKMVDAIIGDDSKVASEIFHGYVTDKVRNMVSPETIVAPSINHDQDDGDDVDDVTPATT